MLLVALCLLPLVQTIFWRFSCYDQRIFSRVLNVFSPIETTHLCIGYFHHNILRSITLFWWFNRLPLSFLDLFFIWSIRRFLVLSKKHTSAYGWGSNYTNTIDVNITGSSGNIGGKGDVTGGGDGSIIDCIASTLTINTFLASFKHFRSIYLSIFPAFTHCLLSFRSLVTFCEVKKKMLTKKWGTAL